MCSRVYSSTTKLVVVQNSNIQNCLARYHYSVPLLEISINGCKIWPLAEKIAKKRSSWLEISFYGCRIWPLAGKIGKNVLPAGTTFWG